jgi:hypothetical protein
MKPDDRDLHWLVVIFLGGVRDVPPDSLDRLRELGLIEPKDQGFAISAKGHEAVAEFQRRLS